MAEFYIWYSLSIRNWTCILDSALMNSRVLNKERIYSREGIYFTELLPVKLDSTHDYTGFNHQCCLSAGLEEGLKLQSQLKNYSALTGFEISKS